MQEQWQCRIAPSLGGGFAGTPNEVWGTVDYEDDTKPTVFFGLYGLPDFYALWRHKGKKAILWAGSDIRHFRDGYWLEQSGSIKINPAPLAEWISDYCTSYVENTVEQRELQKAGIPSIVVPSFLGDISDFPLIEKRNEELQYYSSVSGNDFKLYGWDKIMAMAEQYPEAEFHLFGNTEPWEETENVFVHGRVSQAEMDDKIKHMTGAIRMTEFDGFSEILAKSVLWGQWPISLIDYPFMDKVPVERETLNLEGREFYKQRLNKYPWNVKDNF